LLEVSNLSAGYDLDVIHDVSLVVRERELVALIGANGAGKTTTLKSICGMVRVSSGDVKLDGKSILRMAQKEFANSGINMVPEGRRIFPIMSVRENILIGAYSKRGRDKRKDSLERVYNLFPVLKDRQNQIASTLSGGEQQMLAIARGLMSLPTVLLLDEPSTGLAPIVFEKILKVVQEINEQGVAVLIVEQNVAQTLEIVDRGYVMKNGAVIMEGRSEELRENEKVRTAYLAVR